MARFKYERNLQSLARCVGSTCHDGLLVPGVWDPPWRAPRGVGHPETHLRTRGAVGYAEYSSRTLAPGLQLCKECTLTPPCQHCASWSRSRSETSRGTRKKLQRRKTGHPPDTLHPICRRLRGVQQFMGRHTTMQRGYPGMVERHGARTARRQNPVRPHPRSERRSVTETWVSTFWASRSDNTPLGNTGQNPTSHTRPSLSLAKTA